MFSKALALAVVLCTCGYSSIASGDAVPKIAPAAALQQLKDGNARFAAGKPIHGNADAARITLADKEDQGKYAFATVLSCSDSRVPVELLFDVGIMDIFVVRDAGNVAGPDATGSVEYGVCHVHTPVLVVLGHTKCGAVTTVTRMVNGQSVKLEANIPLLVGGIVPVVKRTMCAHCELHGDALIPFATEENVWQSISDLFRKSPAVREMVRDGHLKVVGAIYDLSQGKVRWLPEEKVTSLLDEAEKNPAKTVEKFASK